MDSYIVISVSSIFARDKLISTIYTNLTKEPQHEFIIQQDQVNRIKIYHNAGDGIRVLIRTYVVVVIPIIIDLSLLDGFTGKVTFELDETIEHLSKIVNKLQKLKGYKVIPESSNSQLASKLTSILGGLNEA